VSCCWLLRVWSLSVFCRSEAFLCTRMAFGRLAAGLCAFFLVTLDFSGFLITRWLHEENRWIFTDFLSTLGSCEGILWFFWISYQKRWVCERNDLIFMDFWSTFDYCKKMLWFWRISYQDKWYLARNVVILMDFLSLDGYVRKKWEFWWISYKDIR
jgi:hypothetical protein